MIIFKSTVRILHYSPALHYMLTRLLDYDDYYPNGAPLELVVTSINDSSHGVDSKHYKDMAIDLRSKNFPNSLKQDFVEKFAHHLNILSKGTRYTVLLEGLGTANEHFHIQVAKGTTYNG